MRLRGRFTLWFALAALVPIAVAALVTREVVARSFRNDYERTRSAAEAAMRHELTRLEAQVVTAAQALASKNHPFIGTVLTDLINGGGQLDAKGQLRLRDWSSQEMSGLGLNVLMVTGPNDRIQIGRASCRERV